MGTFTKHSSMLQYSSSLRCSLTKSFASEMRKCGRPVTRVSTPAMADGRVDLNLFRSNAPGFAIGVTGAALLVASGAGAIAAVFLFSIMVNLLLVDGFIDFDGLGVGRSGRPPRPKIGRLRAAAIGGFDRNPGTSAQRHVGLCLRRRQGRSHRTRSVDQDALRGGRSDHAGRIGRARAGRVPADWGGGGHSWPRDLAKSGHFRRSRRRGLSSGSKLCRRVARPRPRERGRKGGRLDHEKDRCRPLIERCYFELIVGLLGWGSVCLPKPQNCVPAVLRHGTHNSNIFVVCSRAWG